jgi:hypothetical protein
MSNQDVLLICYHLKRMKYLLCELVKALPSKELATENNSRSMPCEHRHTRSGGFAKPDICDDCGEEL